MYGTQRINEVAESGFPFLEKLNLSYKKRKIELSRFDKHSVYLTTELLCEKDTSVAGQVVIYPAGLYLTMILASAFPVILLRSDINEASSDVTKLLKEKDKVKFNGCLGEYLGIEVINTPALGGEVKRLVIRFNDTKVFLPPENAWKLNKYEGDATNLNNYKVKQNQKLKKSKDILSDILDLDQKEIPLIAKSKMVIVTDKKYVYSLFSEIYLEDLPYSAVFPAGYHITSKKFERIGSDTLQRKPMIIFTSNLAVAEELASADPNIKAVLIYGLKKVKQNFVSLDYLQTLSSLQSIMLILDTHEIEDEEISELNSIGMKIRSIIPEQTYIVEDHISTGNDNFFQRSQKAIEMFYNSNLEIVDVNSEIEVKIQHLIDGLAQIRRSHFESENKLTFIRRAYRALYHLRTFPIPLSFQDNFEIYREIVETPDELEDLLFSMYSNMEKNIFIEMKNLVSDLRELINQHSEHHPKEEMFLKLISNAKNPSVIVSNSNQKEMLEKLLKNKPVKFITLNELLHTNELIDSVIFCGWYGQKNAKALLKAGIGEICFICYTFEKQWIRAVKSRQQNLLNNIADKKITNEIYANQFAKNQTEVNWKFEEDLLTILNDFTTIGNASLNLNNNAATTVETIPVEFDDDSVAFLTEGHRCRCIDQDDESIVVKRAVDLEADDEVVFIKDSGEDIFDKFVNSVKQTSPEICKQMDMIRIWKDALINYKNTFEYSYVDLHIQLSKYGCNRTPQTIRLWFGDDCIGPEDEVIDVIAKMTGHKELNENLEQIKQSCKKIRSLHVQLGRYLARLIISSVADNEEIPYIKGIAEDLSKHAQIVRVKKVHQDKIIVPISKVNRLIER